MNPQTYTVVEALTLLTQMGYEEADVLAAVDSCIAAGLEITDQPDDTYILTYGEVHETLVDQLRSATS